MSDLIFYHTGKIQLSKDQTIWVNASFGNAEVSLSPEYVTHKNIKSNEINILKGYKISVELELFFVITDTANYYKIDEFIEILNSLKNVSTDINLNPTGIFGIQKNIYLRFLKPNSTYEMKQLTLNKLSSDFMVTNYISNNMTLGHKINIKLENSNLIQDIPIWVTLDETYTNTVSHTSVAGKMVATDDDWI